MTKTDNDTALLSVAEAVAEGEPVDWDAEIEAHLDLRERLERLRRLEAIVAAHHQAPLESRVESADTVSPTKRDDAAGQGADVESSSLSTWGPLSLLEKIGQGRFGEVYRAFDPALQREVALKLWRIDFTQEEPRAGRFLNEARRLARVRHPNVLVVHGADEHESRVGIWSDLLRGKTLEERLAQQGPFGAHEAALIGIDLCRALAAVHASGLIHRDVKTFNVMREEGGRIVLMDFGAVSEQISEDDTDEGEAGLGTPITMAPEQLSGEAIGPSVDIYGLGVLLYRLVSGRYPIEAESLDELIEKHQRRESKSLRDLRPDLPTAFVQMVERALSPDPQQRYKSAGEMETALASSLDSVAPADVRPPASPRPGLGRFGWVAIAAAVFLTVLVASLVFYLRPWTFTVETTLYRAQDGDKERLLPGGRVFPGDGLFLEIEGSEAMHVYVLNEDEKGNAYVLFPLESLELRNPLGGTIRHRLPGRTPRNWEVTSAGGKETFMVIASRHPLQELEEELAHFPQAEQGRPVQFNSELLRKLRGIGGLTAGGTSTEGGAQPRLSGIARSYMEKPECESGICLWEIQLENPGP